MFLNVLMVSIFLLKEFYILLFNHSLFTQDLLFYSNEIPMANAFMPVQHTAIASYAHFIFPLKIINAKQNVASIIQKLVPPPLTSALPFWHSLNLAGFVPYVDMSPLIRSVVLGLNSFVLAESIWTHPQRFLSLPALNCEGTKEKL